ncbi:MAG: hypothetical protein RID91_16035 [Azospirillaceae bacterium]
MNALPASAGTGGDAATVLGTGGLSLGTGEFEPRPITLGPQTGTEVGRRVRGLAGDLSGLRDRVSGHNSRLQDVRAEAIAEAQEYFALVAAIQARLQAGTTPGNPILEQQWGEAALQLEDLSSAITRMNNLSSQVAGDNSLAGYLLESVRATFRLSGAVEEDHRQLAILEDEVNRTLVLLDRLLSELSEDINRQTRYVNSERSNLQTLQLAIANGELYGTSLANRAGGGLPIRTAAVAPAAPAPDRPLVVIRFDDPNVAYEQPLYDAVSQALDARPGAAFELVAVSRNTGNPAESALAANDARDRAEAVMRTLISLGLPPDRVYLAASQSADVRSNEVRVFVR